MAAQPAITSVGTALVAAGSNVSTISVTLTEDIPAGSLILVGVVDSNSGAPAYSLSLFDLSDLRNLLKV